MVKLQSNSDILIDYYLMGETGEIYKVSKGIMKIENDRDIQFFIKKGFKEIEEKKKGGK